MFLEKVRSGKNKWYIYLFSLLIIFTAIQIGNIPLVAYLKYVHPDTILSSGNINEVTSTNIGLALALLGFAAGLFGVLFCVRTLHGRSYSSVITGRDRIDWKRIGFSAGIWGGLNIIAFALQYLLGDSSDIVFNFEPQNFFILLLVALTLLPFQTSFEEVMFRGYLMQWSALLFRYRWIPVVVTGVIFGLMHCANPEIEAYGIWIAMPQYILMGLLLGYITVKDDGLELALGFHFANNFMACTIITSDASALQTHALFRMLNPTSSHWDTLVLLVSGIIFIWICNRKYHFMNKINLWSPIAPVQEKNTEIE